MTLDVDPTTTGTPGELRVLTRRDRNPRLAVELLELLEHHGARRHVDTECEGLRGEDDAHKLAAEQLLDGLLERRQHPCVVRRDSPLEAAEPFPVSEHPEVLVGDRPTPLFDEGADLIPLGRRGEPNAGPQHLGHCCIASGPAENEENRRDEIAIGEQPDDGGPVDAELLRPPTPGVVAADILHLASAEGPAPVARHLHELGVDPVGLHAAGAIEEVDELRAHEDVLLEWHRPLLGDDHGGIAAHGLEPIAELLGVRHGRAERHEAHGGREVDDDLLPHGAAEPVGEVVHLVHDDEAEIRQQV